MEAFERLLSHQRLKKSVGAVLEIHSVRGITVNSGKRLVFIRTFKSDSISFLTSLKFPVKSHYRLGFKIILPAKSLFVTGEVIWTRKDNNLNLYGVKLFMDDELRLELRERVLDMQRQTTSNTKIHESYRQMSEWPTWENRLDICQ